MFRLLRALKQDALDYTRGKTWWIYLLVWLAAAYIFYAIVSGGQRGTLILHPMYLVNSGVHELTHWLMSTFTAVVNAASGSISEIILGFLFVLGGLQTRSYFAASLSSLWLMFSHFDMGTYMADARALKLTLMSIESVTGSGNEKVIHDWRFVFTKLGVLQQDIFISNIVKFLGLLWGLLGLGVGLWLIWRMAHPAVETPEALYPTTTKGRAGTNPQLAKAKQPASSLYPDASRGIGAPHNPIASKGAPLSTLYPTASHGALRDDEILKPDEEKTDKI